MNLDEVKAIAERHHGEAREKLRSGKPPLAQWAFFALANGKWEATPNDAADRAGQVMGYLKISTVARSKKAEAIVLLTDVLLTRSDEPNRQGTLQAIIISPTGIIEAELTAEYRTKKDKLIFDSNVWNSKPEDERKKHPDILPWADGAQRPPLGTT